MGLPRQPLEVRGLGTTTIQWWPGVDELYAYANATPLEHRPAWLAVHRAARSDPSAVTTWHQTYAVSAAESLDTPTR